ncbi:MAG TPA: DUF2520 domain-containing protein [Deltaproteobacteria bacterium]|nr:DUF2520 domain-containing protein [Deltaproteobacteria bacterium]
MGCSMKKKFYTFSIVGLGMVGTAIGSLLKNSGHKIAALYDKSPTALKRAKKYIGGINLHDAKEAPLHGECILITTPDDIISSVCREIALSKAIKGKYVFHMSGAGGVDLLFAAKKAGAYVGSIHPLQSFSSIANAVKNIPGSYFGITATGKAKPIAKNIVGDLNGIPLFISDAQKPLYHAAACFASNYLVTLLNTVESIYQTLGFKNRQARKAYLPLVYGSLKNIERSGPVKALTGPIARGDTSTIQKHISTIKRNSPGHLGLYYALGLATVDTALRKKSINEKQANQIRNILAGVKS